MGIAGARGPSIFSAPPGENEEADWLRFRGHTLAPGAPGIEPRWTHGNKQAVGTACSLDSRLWFTIWNGIVTEAFFPLVDHAQLRDLQFLVTDGDGVFHEEKRHLRSQVRRLAPTALGYRIRTTAPDDRYHFDKTVITDPRRPCLLEHVRFVRESGDTTPWRLFVLCAPHLELGGWENNARIAEVNDQPVLTAEKNGIWLAVAATIPFRRASCGYVGSSDGWTDLSLHRRMTWEFDQALDGNVALTGEIPIDETREFTLGLAFGRSLQSAVETLFQSLTVPFSQQRDRFVEQWEAAARRVVPLHRVSGDGGQLYHGSYGVLLSHEDKVYPGAFIASLSIPWGAEKGDEDRGGYHLVWTRDLVQTATGLLAAGDVEAARRALAYLSASQQPDGGFPQNFWLNGEPYWQGVQLDEVAYPILLAAELRRAQALGTFDPYPMVTRAARYLVEHGPATQQERWEELGGFSPSTLAVHIAALVSAGGFARERGDPTTARFLEEYADFLETHVDRWTVTSRGELVPGLPRHYVRILPVNTDSPHPPEDPDEAVMKLKNLPPGTPSEYPARNVVDAGFLELVRWGIRAPDNPLVTDSLQVIDRVLRVDTPAGPCWHRFNHDGYGQRPDGGPYVGWGRGRAWPLLTGERGHYEVAAGRDAAPFLRAMEHFASEAGLLPEQIWDEADRPDFHLTFGGPTESAMPLAWAHAEYVKLLRSIRDGKVFDRLPEVAERYLGSRSAVRPRSAWKFDYQPQTVRQGEPLRILVGSPFVVRWTQDHWRHHEEVASTATSLRLHYADLPTDVPAPIEFTFYWPVVGRWEGRNYTVQVRNPSD
jgi:glucoamylase